MAVPTLIEFFTSDGQRWKCQATLSRFHNIVQREFSIKVLSFYDGPNVPSWEIQCSNIVCWREIDEDLADILIC